jgi:hypothetical protein
VFYFVKWAPVPASVGWKTKRVKQLRLFGQCLSVLGDTWFRWRQKDFRERTFKNTFRHENRIVQL